MHMRHAVACGRGISGASGVALEYLAQLLSPRGLVVAGWVDLGDGVDEDVALRVVAGAGSHEQLGKCLRDALLHLPRKIPADHLRRPVCTRYDSEVWSATSHAELH